MKSRPVHAVAALIRSAVVFHFSSFVGPFMTIAVPLGFLVFFAFMRGAAQDTVSIRVGVASASASAAQAVADRLAVFPQNRIVLGEDDLDAAISSGRIEVGVIAGGTDGREIETISLHRNRAFADLIALELRDPPPTAPPPVRFVEENAGGNAILGGIMTMGLLGIGLLGAGVKVLSDRASGTYRLLSLTKTPRYLLLVGDAVAYLAITALYTGAFVWLAIALMNFDVNFDALASTLGVALGVSIVFVSFGVALASVLPNYRNGVHVFTLVNLFMLFLGDLMIPNTQFEATRPIAMLLPTTHAASLVRYVMTDSAPVAPFGVSVAYLVAFGAICLVVTRFRFKTTAGV